MKISQEYKSKKFTIRALSDNEVVVDYHYTDHPYSVAYWAPPVGGYVYILDDDGAHGKPVCDGMKALGATLHYHADCSLLETLKPELRTWARRN